ncbi:MAG TPA: DUF3943 domain-containing protein, partial [Methylophilaceae bacterium]|nr:DUF3943 domain-containing protein [Methylophilaceae bacterium]
MPTTTCGVRITQLAPFLISPLIWLASPTPALALEHDQAAGITLAENSSSEMDTPTDTPEDAEAREKSYLIPALDIVGFDFLLNQFNRHFSNSDDYDSNLNTIRHNLQSSWHNDHDPFDINQLGHPYQGSMYHGFARSAGLTYWESLAYTLGGSAFWEIAGEKTPPSSNDMISTGIGGSFLGESLFRMSSLILEKSHLSPFWRETAAAAVSPATGFNRLAFDRFDQVFSSHDAAWYSRTQIGFANTLHADHGTSSERKENDGQLDFSLSYGLPGQPGYSYTRPFDYFVFQGTASTINVFENIMTRGLLLGTDYS